MPKKRELFLAIQAITDYATVLRQKELLEAFSPVKPTQIWVVHGAKFLILGRMFHWLLEIDPGNELSVDFKVKMNTRQSPSLLLWWMIRHIKC